MPRKLRLHVDLTDVTYDWISGRKSIPVVDRPIKNARIGTVLDTTPDFLGAVDKFGDPEIFGGASIGAVFTQGEPRRPGARWLPTIESTNKAVALNELAYFENSLAPGQAEEVRKLIGRVTGIFRKILNSRKAKLNRRFTEVFGYGQAFELHGRPITDEMIEDYHYEDILDFLEEEEKQTKKKERVRGWRIE